MKKLVRSSVYVLALSIASFAATPLMASSMAQDRDHDRDNQAQNHDRDDRGMNGNESAYYNNKYYKQGWKDGENHKRRNKKWKNENDRRAYEAGYGHGDHGERWHKPMRDNDHHDNDRH
jgi:hypothetical protein